MPSRASSKSKSGPTNSPRKNSMQPSALWLSAMLVLAAGGCAGYRLGPTNADATRGRSIQVNFFQNRTLEPRLAEAVNHALRKSLQQDGTYKLNTRGDGDII